jgi:hypothetical protein
MISIIFVFLSSLIALLCLAVGGVLCPVPVWRVRLFGLFFWGLFLFFLRYAILIRYSINDEFLNKDNNRWYIDFWTHDLTRLIILLIIAELLLAVFWQIWRAKRLRNDELKRR